LKHTQKRTVLLRNSICILIVFLFIIPTQFVSAQETEIGNKELKILSWNIYMLPRFALLTGKRKRAREIAKLLPAENYDIIVFQEAFHGDARRILKRKWKELYPVRIGPANRNWWWIKVNSGVWIMSKMPLKELEEIKYKDCDGFIDCFANKGALLVEGEFEGQKFQLLGTHIQAGGPDSIKQKQYEAIRVLTDQYKEDGVPQLLVGDFNKGKDNGHSYDKMLSTLDVKDYEPDSEMKFTAGSDNDFRLGGNDRLIDFIFYRPNGVEPKKMIRNVRRFRSEQPCFKNISDLSDHYAMEVILKF
jgi:endonuclease/exonuclease/phosphatase family metal-dependent hydrolase